VRVVSARRVVVTGRPGTSTHPGVLAGGLYERTTGAAGPDPPSATAVPAMRRSVQLGQRPRCLQLNATTNSSWQAPQGGPLSPLLSNIVLDELDWELEERGHRFVRYADDSNIYVCSERAGHRVMATVVRFIERRLRLKVNAGKSAVARPEERHFVGFRLRRNWETAEVEVLPSKRSVDRLADKIRRLTPRKWGSRSTAVFRDRTGTSEDGSASSGSAARQRKLSAFFTTRMLISDGACAPFCFGSGSASASSYDASFVWGHDQAPRGVASTGDTSLSGRSATAARSTTR
jgi:hypothetical protein